MKTKYRLAIFDFDGTLADSFPWFLGVINRVADRYRFRRMEDREVESFRGRSSRELIRHLGIPAWKLPLIARHMRRLMAEEIDRIALFPGAGGLLRSLSDRGVVTAIVSSNSERNVRRVLGRDADLVGHYACGASLFGKRSKFRMILRRGGIAADSAISIGDEIRDLQASREAGIAFGGVSWGYTDAAAFREQGPDLMFEDFDAILDALR